MAKYILKRIIAAIPIILGAMILIFLLMRLAGGSPVDYLLEPDATEEEEQALIERFGLDKPLPEQFLVYVKNLLKGDWGTSYFNKQDVLVNLKNQFEPTIIITIYSTLISVLIGIPIGVIAATHRNSWLDYTLSTTSMLVMVIPTFWFGLMSAYILGFKLKLFPVQGYQRIAQKGFWNSIYYLTLPSVISGLNHVASLARNTRSYMLDVLNEDYIRTAKAKGLPVWKIRYKHALKNAISLVLTMIVTSIVALLGGSTIIEKVFNINGVGRLAYDSLTRRDYAQEEAILLIFTLAHIAVHLLMDIIYKWLDPRVDYNK